MSGPPRKPTAWRRMEGNRGKKAWNRAEPIPPEGVPDCPEHLGEEARAEWYRLVDTLATMGVITIVDRAVLAAYCQAYGRWVEAEQKLKEAPLLFKTPSGYVQQSPWLNIANRQMELMGRYMAEIGLTPASRSRIAVSTAGEQYEPITRIEMVIVDPKETRNQTEKPAEQQSGRGEQQSVRGDANPRLLEISTGVRRL